ncbi:MAG: VOC family protein [Pseudomonadota bacterium]
MRGFAVKALGEIAIRCSDVSTMMAFYRDIIGLDVLSGDNASDIVFFKISEGYDGHTCVLALFAHDAGRPEIHPRSDKGPATGAGSSLHHIALTVDFTAQEAAMAWYDQNNIDYSVQQFGWIGWRGIFTRDPEGNTVELVAYDASLQDTAAA